MTMKKAALQMLDAAHGEAVGTLDVAHDIDACRIEVQTARTGPAGRRGGRTPAPAARTDIRQGSRRVDAVARSRRVKQSLG